MTDMRVKRFLKKFVQTLIAVYSGVGEWLDILWCSVCLCLTFVTFFVKKYFLAHINFNKVYFKFILFLSVAALRVCVEDRHLFTESRRACTGDRRSRRVLAICGIGYSQKRRSSIARFVLFRRRFGEGAPSGVVVRLAELRLDARANVWIMMK